MMAPDYGAAPAKNPSGGAGLTGNAGNGSKTRQPTGSRRYPTHKPLRTAHSGLTRLDPTLADNGGGMSDQTLQAVHDAIAAHIADENKDEPEYLTEWVLIASCAIPADASQETYYIYATDMPVHHTLGLLRYGALRADNDLRADVDGDD